MPQRTTMIVTAYTPWLRVTTGALFGISRIALPYLLVLVLLSTDPPVTPDILLRLFAVSFVVPGFLSAALQRTSRAELEMCADGIRIRGPYLDLEVPLADVAAADVWCCPVPEPGISIRLHSGEKTPRSLGVADPGALIERIHAAARPGRPAAAPLTPLRAWAIERAPARRTSWRHALVKYVVFGALPAAVLFNAHQHISYGGLWGQYYMHGAAAWTRTLMLYWATTAIYVLLFAAVLRGLGEGIGLLATRVAPSHARTVRRGVERFCRVGYYAGVPALLGFRFLA